MQRPNMASQQCHRRSMMVMAVLGGALMALSMFFRLSYGPMGGEISYYSLISHNLSWGGWPMLLIAWPVAFGVFETVFGLALVNDRALAVNAKWHSIAVGLLLLLIAGLQVLLLVRQAQLVDLFRREVIISLVPVIGVLVAVGSVVILKRPVRERLQWLRIIGTGWIIVGLFPVSSWVPLADVFHVYGIGYWMLLTGTLMVTTVSICQLAVTE